jgi:hypothetical protein
MVHGAVVSGNVSSIREYSSTVKIREIALKGQKISGKKGSKVHTINKFRDKMNTLSVTECLFRMEQTRQFRDENVQGCKDVEIYM